VAEREVAVLRLAYGIGSPVNPIAIA